MAPRDPAETARLVRAAEAYAGMTHAELAEETGISVAKLRRYMSVLEPYVPNRDELDAIAIACEVPARFLLDGFVGLEEAANVVERLDALERAVRRPDADDDPPATQPGADESLREALDRLPKPPGTKPNREGTSAPRRRREAS